jgi:predicted acyl esterase
VVGYPVVHLWTSSTSTDQDFFYYLERVREDGTTELLTNGAIRASNRATRRAPFENFGLPWHGSIRADQQPLVPGVPVKIDTALFPIAFHLDKGESLRLAVTNFDKGNYLTPVPATPATVTIYFTKDHQSTLTLPVTKDGF